MAEIINFPDAQSKAWDEIEVTVRHFLDKFAAPPKAREEIVTWAHALYLKYSTPHVVINTPEEAEKFYKLLQEQKIMLFFEALNQKILTYRD